MAKKRERLEVIYDMLRVIRDSHNKIKPTRLLYASNLSQKMFKTYVEELTEKNFIESYEEKKSKYFTLTEKGFEFLKEYKAITQVIESFGL